MLNSIPSPPTAPAAALPRDRKSEHLRIALADGVDHRSGTQLDQVRMRHRALPERRLEDVSLQTSLAGFELGVPLLISAMTGGTPEAQELNRSLMNAAAAHGAGFVFGSGRALLSDPSLLATYRPAGADRPPLLLANLGGAQVRGASGPAEAERLVEALDADGVTIHLNPLQEAIQPEGEVAWDGVREGIAAVVTRLRPRPVIVKEVGFGIDAEDVRALADAGVAAIDVAGAGGTNWALVESRRDDRVAAVGAAFADWGLGTRDALLDARAAVPDLPRIASGGLRDGVDCAKCVALGAHACGIARPLLLAARAGRATQALGDIVRQLRIATWLAGAGAAAELSEAHLR